MLLSLAIAPSSLGIPPIAPSAFAAMPDESCWGVVTPRCWQRPAPGSARMFSAQSEPRLGPG